MSSFFPENESSVRKNVHLEKENDVFFQRVISEVEDYAILLIDKQGTILTWNKGAEKIKGYSANEIIGRNYRQFYQPEDIEQQLPERLLNTALTTGKANHEGWRVRKDGTKFWANVTITAVHNDLNEVVGFLKVTRDLTERKMSEERRLNFLEDLKKKNEELLKSEERYHNMIAEVQDYAIILLDENGIILDWNKGAEKLKGYSSKEIIGTSFRQFYQEVDRQAGLPESLLAEAARNGRVAHEGWRLKKDGTRFWGSVTISALHNHEGNIIGFTKVTRDLTERKDAEESLKDKAEELLMKNRSVERLNEELTSFTYVASHDLKEPLRKISTFTSRLESEEIFSEKGKVYLEKVKSSALKMQNLIEDLLSYSRISNDLIAFERIDLNEIGQGARNDLEIMIAEMNAVITMATLPVISGIRYQLHQLFLNLFINALKYSKPGVAPLITVNCEVIAEEAQADVKDKKEFYHISVQDNGIGFSAELADRIFVPFQRVHPASVSSGTGIGLAIVKRVVENHRGRVVAQGKPGEGAVFHLYFPLQLENNLWKPTL